MYLPASRPDPIEVIDSSRTDDFAALAQALAERGGMTLVYAPSTTTITHAAPVAGPAPAPVEVRVMSPARPVQAEAWPTPALSRYTFGEVVAYCGATLMGAGILSDLVTALLRVPLLVPVLGGATALVGFLAVIAGSRLDLRERAECVDPQNSKISVTLSRERFDAV